MKKVICPINRKKIRCKKIDKIGCETCMNLLEIEEITKYKEELERKKQQERS